MRILRGAILFIAALFVARVAWAQGASHTTVTTAAPTAGTMSQVLAGNDARKSCTITNISGTAGWCQFVPLGFGIATSNAIPVPNNGQFSCNDPYASAVVHSEPVYCTCTSGTCSFVIDSAGQ